MKTENNQTVAKEILRQLGGNKFIMMTGAKSLACDSHGLQFRIGRNKGGYQGVKIELDSLDLYKVTFWKTVKKYDLKSDVFDMIYADQLQELFTEKTGLHTSL